MDDQIIVLVVMICGCMCLLSLVGGVGAYLKYYAPDTDATAPASAPTTSTAPSPSTGGNGGNGIEGYCITENAYIHGTDLNSGPNTGSQSDYSTGPDAVEKCAKACDANPDCYAFSKMSETFDFVIMGAPLKNICALRTKSEGGNYDLRKGCGGWCTGSTTGIKKSLKPSC